MKEGTGACTRGLLLAVLGGAIALAGCEAPYEEVTDPETGTAGEEGAVVALTPIEQLGKKLFFDANLSKNRNQSCATCHDPAAGFAGGRTASASQINAKGAVYPGSDPALFGNRKPPSAAYAGDSPNLAFDAASGAWVGGMFWDGRATGEDLGDPLAEQAKGPFLNPLEMALPSASALRQRVAEGSYANLFDQVFGPGALASDPEVVHDRIGIAIAAYERSAEVSAYTSKFDAFWDRAKAKKLDVTKIRVANYKSYRNLGLTDTELFGLATFNDPGRANCASCHSMAPGAKGRPLFTDFTYDNLGLPRNPENPFYKNVAYNPAGSAWVDTGLGGYLATAPGVTPAAAAAEVGKVKVPTLRNVDRRPYSTFVRAYGHNGAFKSLADIVWFYHCRGMHGGMGGGMGGGGMGGGGMMGGMCSSAPEVADNLGTLPAFPGMDRGYIVAFLKTLTDGYVK